jgi:hypothetical protein
MTVPAALEHHYRELLGLVRPWKITDIALDVIAQRVDITLEWPAERKVPCPECGRKCGRKDHREKRTRYLFLRRPERWSKKQRAQFRDIKREFGQTRFAQSRIGRMWAIKEAFRLFWNYASPIWAMKCFQRWFFWATQCLKRRKIRI